MVFDFERFQSRHIGPDAEETAAMLKAVGAASLDALIDEAIPSRIRLKQPPDLPEAQSEHHFLKGLQDLAARNQIFRSFLGLGYYDCVTPSVILRNVLENPGWYTPYTPYQAEIAQGRLEALLNFQTMVRDLTAMEVANASLLDEATAAAEAMTMLARVQAKRIDNVVGPAQFFVADTVFPQTLAVLRARAEPLGIELLVGDADAVQFSDRTFGALIQTPDEAGRVRDIREFMARAKRSGVAVAVGSDLLGLTLITPPGELGADVVYGNSQRFGVPLGYGGPHAAFFGTLERHVRQAPGRIIGVSIDAHGNTAYRMSLQTREQHIRREKATSNICTAQALLANIAGLYAVYHGPKGLTRIARRVHGYAKLVERELADRGVRQLNDHYFDTLRVQPTGGAAEVERIKTAATRLRLNFRYRDDGTINIALDETTDEQDVAAILLAFTDPATQSGRTQEPQNQSTRTRERQNENAERRTPNPDAYPPHLARASAFLTHPVFNTHHSETQMMRYIRALERKDIGLDTSMIPLGSCTMKLNATAEMYPVTWPEIGKLHPFAPVEQAKGYTELFDRLEKALAEITGFAAVSLQPNAGSQGEYAGLLVIHKYHHSRGDTHRDVCLIPQSAHGTNPASAVMAGMKVVVVKTDANGNIDVADLEKQAKANSASLSALMV
ncbi:MAG: aminomethyl-transferring glycine dehydrogenase, partial [Acidobacteria bacterium]|nr:aminomethyl-transferring glycine dehydrogenase [Acidobacteriota bacterium]